MPSVLLMRKLRPREINVLSQDQTARYSKPGFENRVLNLTFPRVSEQRQVKRYLPDYPGMGGGDKDKEVVKNSNSKGWTWDMSSPGYQGMQTGSSLDFQKWEGLGNTFSNRIHGSIFETWGPFEVQHSGTAGKHAQCNLRKKQVLDWRQRKGNIFSCVKVRCW